MATFSSKLNRIGYAICWSRPRSGEGAYQGIDRVLEDTVETRGIFSIYDYLYGDKEKYGAYLLLNYVDFIECYRSMLKENLPVEGIVCVPEMLRHDKITSRKQAIALGYDVAGISGDCWSIVASIESESWEATFRSQLNTNGLFEDLLTAQDFLRNYIARKEPDHDLPLEIVYMERLLIEPTAL